MKTLLEKISRRNQLAEGRELIICDYQHVCEVVTSGNTGRIKNCLHDIYSGYSISRSHSGSLTANSIGESILELVSSNSNDFTKDIATRALSGKFELSEKQKWCVAYQVTNNLEVYKIAALEQWKNAIESDEDNQDRELSILTYEIYSESI